MKMMMQFSFFSVSCGSILGGTLKTACSPDWRTKTSKAGSDSWNHFDNENTNEKCKMCSTNLLYT